MQARKGLAKLTELFNDEVQAVLPIFQRILIVRTVRSCSSFAFASSGIGAMIEARLGSSHSDNRSWIAANRIRLEHSIFPRSRVLSRIGPRDAKCKRDSRRDTLPCCAKKLVFGLHSQVGGASHCQTRCGRPHTVIWSWMRT